MSGENLTRDQIAEKYLEQLPYAPYPVQEEALLTWFTAEEGELVCAPTGTGKTLIAHAAMFEALHTGQVAYYTTPLIALTEQKFAELRAQAVEWGFREEDVGLVTGNRRVNPDAKVLVVVAEILLNRLLNPSAFDFDRVCSVVMDEFHSFNDPERGIVWELSLSMLPKHVRLMLLSATVGNAYEFLAWLRQCHNRRVELVQSTDRKVPLEYHWIPDQFLADQVEIMAMGSEEEKKTPTLVFCFNREECWTVAEQLKGKDLLTAAQREPLRQYLERCDWSQGAGPKMKQLLYRGVGVHHAGLLPKYRRIVEELYVRKLLPVCVCTETLAAGINLPARSVVLSTLLKGPFGKKKVIGASTAHQIFGRAGRPQFDDRGYVYALAHEDDVRILRWQEKFDALPADSKDPGILKAKKALKKKRPTRRENQQYWTQQQFEKLIAAPPANLYSRGPLPYRLLAYLLKKSPDVDKLRGFVRKRLMDAPRIEAGVKLLEDMLMSLWEGGFVELEPQPPKRKAPTVETAEPPKTEPETPRTGLLENVAGIDLPKAADERAKTEVQQERYTPQFARPTAKLDTLLIFRSVHPLYGAFLLEHLGIANRAERIKALESVLGLPRPLLKYTRVPTQDELPPGPLESGRLDPELISRGLIIAKVETDEEQEDDRFDERFEPTLADKLRMLFDAKYPNVDGFETQPIWAAGELLRFGGDFNKYVRTHDLIKQEGIIFRHCLRLILLCAEFSAVCPEGTTLEEWRADLRNLAAELTASCRKIDPESTQKLMEQALAADVVEGETHSHAVAPSDLLQAQVDAVAEDDDAWREEWERHWDQMLEEMLPE